MKRRLFLVLILTLAPAAARGTAPAAPGGRGDSPPSGEYRIKAAFLYNFLKFVTWREDKTAPAGGSPRTSANTPAEGPAGDPAEAPAKGPFVIGVLGEDPFGRAFDGVIGESVRGRKVAVARIGTFEDLLRKKKGDPKGHLETIAAIRKCRILFVASSEKKHFKEILALVEGTGVVTVGDAQGFLAAGGIIRFVVRKKRVRFEVNFTAAKTRPFKISSKLLSLAVRVI